jgi:ATP-dependent RNA helicase DDX31/DBP7
LNNRGVDVGDINWIVQYDPPGEPADYIHRAGRTARVGKEGKAEKKHTHNCFFVVSFLQNFPFILLLHIGNALLFLMPSEVAYIDLMSKQSVEMEKLDLNEVLQYVNAKADDEGSYALQWRFERLVLGDEQARINLRFIFLAIL